MAVSTSPLQRYDVSTAATAGSDEADKAKRSCLRGACLGLTQAKVTSRRGDMRRSGPALPR